MPNHEVRNVQSNNVKNILSQREANVSYFDKFFSWVE